MHVPTQAVAASITVIVPARVLLLLSFEVVALALLVYIGIALPAVWSSRPARRKAAEAVIRQILNALTDKDQ
jgi:hypothetical protein